MTSLRHSQTFSGKRKVLNSREQTSNNKRKYCTRMALLFEFFRPFVISFKMMLYFDMRCSLWFHVWFSSFLRLQHTTVVQGFVSLSLLPVSLLVFPKELLFPYVLLLHHTFHGFLLSTLKKVLSKSSHLSSWTRSPSWEIWWQNWTEQNTSLTMSLGMEVRGELASSELFTAYEKICRMRVNTRKHVLWRKMREGKL